MYSGNAQEQFADCDTSTSGQGSAAAAVGKLPPSHSSWQREDARRQKQKGRK